MSGCESGATAADRPGIAVSLGSNLGDRRGQLARALEVLGDRYGVVEVSGVYQSRAVGTEVEGQFLNLCVQLEAPPGPRGLLEGLMEIEGDAGRPRGGLARRGDRRLDLDLLLYEDCILRERDLRVPHPRMCQRAFVMVPLCELGPVWSMPGTGRSVRAIASELDGDGVERIGAAGSVLVRRSWIGTSGSG